MYGLRAHGAHLKGQYRGSMRVLGVDFKHDTSHGDGGGQGGGG